MKTIMIILGALVAVALALQGWSSYSTSKTEEQPYKVVQDFGEFEVRHYPSAIMATVESNHHSYKTSSDQNFGRLAGFIFGGNQEQQKIAMTSPVHMTFSDSNSTMSFVMPTEYEKSELPTPTDKGVQIHTTEATHMAAIGFGGFSSDGKIAEYTEKLRAALEAEGISHRGDFRYMGYNPPWEVIARRNEVAVTIDWNQ